MGKWFGQASGLKAAHRACSSKEQVAALEARLRHADIAGIWLVVPPHPFLPTDSLSYHEFWKAATRRNGLLYGPKIAAVKAYKDRTGVASRQPRPG